MAIEESKIIDLINSYKKYEGECQRSSDSVNISRAGLYRAVILDLENLLPRKTLADIARGDVKQFIGTWVKIDGKKALIVDFEQGAIDVVFPESKSYGWFNSSDAYPLYLQRVWDEDGDLVY